MEVTGYPASDFMQNRVRSFFSIVHSDDRDKMKQEINENIRLQKSYVVEYRIICKDGSIKWIQERAAPIFNENGECTNLDGVLYDITDKKKIEQNLKIAADTARFYLDLLGHDIRNHLQAIAMAKDLLSNQDLGVEAELTLEIISSSIEEAQQVIQNVEITRDLLDAPLVAVNLYRALKNVISSYKHLNEVSFILDIADESIRIKADQHFTYLIKNIIDNAIKYNQQDRKLVWISIQEKDGGYEIVIGDNGIGISSVMKETLFDPNRRFGGVGIHQAVKIAEKYGGRINVRDRIANDPVHGTEFVIWLPMGKKS